jgi:hypothetical protein
MHTHSPKTQKIKKMSACQKADGVSCDSGVLMVEFMQQGATITSEEYSETLKKLCRAIQGKKRGMLTSGVVLFHDNTRPNTAAHTRALLEHFNWELFDHPPYSLHLASSENHTFTYLKNWLRPQCFSNNEDLMEGGETSLSSQEPDIYDTGI